MQLTRAQGIGLIIGAVLLAVFGYGVWLMRSNTQSQALVKTPEIDMDEASREYFEQRLQITQAAITARQTAGQEVDLDLYMSVASDAYALGDWQTSRDMLEQLLSANSINYVAWINYAHTLTYLGELELAEEAYKNIFEITTSISEYYRDYADFLTKYYPERQADIKVIYEEDVKHNGQSVWNMVGLAQWYADQGDCVRAVDHYDVAISLNPTSQDLQMDKRSLQQSCQQSEN